ncbi:1731_t:CDS:1, partial [Racocetra fulgida]
QNPTFSGDSSLGHTAWQIRVVRNIVLVHYQQEYTVYSHSSFLN